MRADSMNRTSASSSHSLAAILVALVTIILGTACVDAQTAPATASASSDLSWMRDYAAPFTGAEKGRGSDIKWDPRFRALMQSSLHQQQRFWRDHGRFLPVPELVQTFIGVPQGISLDQSRYMTVTGCVPHDCGDRGLIWIDTAADKTTLIFAATGQISNGPGDTMSHIHLWLFSSTTLNWQRMPVPFLTSFSRWNNTYLGKIIPENIVLVTLVQPSGETVDLSPSIFSLSAPQSGAGK
jgi:hypothetical protein